MASTDLYRLAFAYKKTKLWKKLYDDEIFAVRLPDGEIGYCSVMGYLGEHVALSLYVGASGWGSYLSLLRRAGADDEDLPVPGTQAPPTWLLVQDCIQCSLEDRDELSDEELAEARAAAKALGIVPRGARAFPQFTRYIPDRWPWPLRDERDEARIGAALSAALALSALLEIQNKRDLGFFEVDEETRDVPFFDREGDGWTLDRTPLPDEGPRTFPTPGEPDRKVVAALRKLKKGGIMECEIVRMAEPVQEGPGEAPWFPVLLLCVDTRRGDLLPMRPVLRYEEDPDALRDAFVEALMESGQCPRAVKVRNESARALMEGLCARAGILLSMDADLPALDEVKESFFALLQDAAEGSGPAGEIVEALDGMSDEEIGQMPDVLADQILEMADLGLLPQALEARLRRIFGR